MSSDLSPSVAPVLNENPSLFSDRVIQSNQFNDLPCFLFLMDQYRLFKYCHLVDENETIFYCRTMTRRSFSLLIQNKRTGEYQPTNERCSNEIKDIRVLDSR